MKKILVCVLLCFSLLLPLCFVGCGNKTSTPENESILSVAITQMKSSSKYTIWTIVESQSTGVKSEKTEVVSLSDDRVTVLTTNKTPNEIGADEEFTITTEETTYNKNEFVGVTLNVEGLDYIIDGNIIEIELTSDAKVESVFGLKGVSAANIRIKLKDNAFEYLTYTYITSENNKVTVTVK